MKTTKGYIYALMACAALTFSACDKNKENGGLSENPSVDEVANLPYSDLTSEQQKEKLTAEANAFINEMKGLKDAKAPEVLASLFGLMNTGDIPEGLGSKIDGIEDITAISEFYGKYTWNNGGWSESASADKLVFEFPVSESQTNNGRLEVTGESSFTMGGIVFPKLLNAKIFLNNAEVGSINAMGDLLVANDQPAVPSTANLSISMDGYSIAENFTKSNATASLSLKKNGNELMAIVAKLDGNLDAMIENEAVPNGGNFSMTLMNNLVLVGKVDFANFNKELAALEEQCNTASGFDDVKYAKGNVELFNKYCEVYLASSKENTKIAKLVAKLVNGNSSALYLRFKDNTDVAADVYFTEVFERIAENFLEFLQSLGIDFSSLGDIDHPDVDYPEPQQ